MAYKRNSEIKNAINLALGITPEQDEIANLQRKVNKITSRLFKDLLTPTERMVCDQMNVSYLDAVRRKLQGQPGSNAALAELDELEQHLKK